MEDTIKRLEAVCSRLEKVALKAAGGAADADPESLPEGYVEMQEAINTKGGAFIDLWAGIDGGEYAKVEVPVKELFQKTCNAVLQILAITNKCKKPDDAAWGAALAPIQACIQEASGIARTRKKKWRAYDDYHVVLESLISGFGWVAHKPPSLPKSYWDSSIDSMVVAMQSKCWKKKKDEHKDHLRAWMAAGKEFGAAVSDVIKAHYKVGVEFWGQEAFALGDAPAAPAKAADKKEEEVAAAGEAKQQAVPDVGAELAKGLAVTGTLKKVKKEQRNKYSGEKISGKVSAGPSKARVKKKKKAVRQKRGLTWFFNDYQNMGGADGMTVIDNAEEYPMRMSLYLCAGINSDFKVGTKVKTITLDSCKRVQVQVDADILSSIELINCSNCTIFVNGTVGTITMDKCDSPTFYFGEKTWEKAERKPEVIYSSCSAANICYGGKTYALPEQFKFLGDKDGKAEVELLEHAD